MGKVLEFFIYDSIKLLLLLWTMIFVIGVLRSYLPGDKIKNWARSTNPFLAHLGASIFGAITPFCSCSSIPMFFGFVKAGIPLGITFSFLITSPILNEYLFVLMIGTFGLKIALLYAASGIVIGTVSGMIIGRMKLEKYLEKDFAGEENVDNESKYFVNQAINFKDRLKFGAKEAGEIVLKIWKWVLAGVAVGALIHNYVPDDLVQTILETGGVFTVPLLVLAGIPMYGNCAAIVPIAVVLFNKGVPLGAALAFMMAVSALSFPEAIILRRAMNIRLIGIFFIIVFFSIVLIGYLF